MGNIRLLLERGGRRIGHGIVLKEDEELLRQVAERGVAVECCITGNVGGRVKSYAVHPIREMLAAGVRCSYRELVSDHGHDAFLAEPKLLIDVLTEQPAWTNQRQTESSLG